MAWKEADLLNDLALKFKAIDTPTEQEISYGVSWMLVNVFEIGMSETGAVPTARKRNIAYYVKDRGKADEEAWYADEPKNVSAKDPVDAKLTGNDMTAALYRNETLHNKVLGQICTSARDIFWESTGAVSHTERLTLAMEVLKDAEKWLKAFMAFVALDTVIRGKGALASDSEIATVVNSWWTNIATA